MRSDFTVIAIIAAHNEADIIGQVVADLIGQDVQVYFLDDDSTDNTVAEVEPYVGRGVIRIEHLSETFGVADRCGFEWERILCRKAQLATELDGHWFIHHDADEFRESPWASVGLKEAIRRVDARAFNAIDFALLDFHPVHDEFRAGDDVRDAFPLYEPGASYDRLQVRCWKRTEEPVDLASSGGHDAQFPGRRVFPIRFLLRHYPIRGQTHGQRKIFQERRPRFLDRERSRGWHVQYDAIREDTSFVHERAELTPFDPDDVRLELVLRHRWVEELEENCEAARSQAKALGSEIEASTRVLEARTRELEARTHELEACQQELDARAQELALARAELGAQRVGASDLRREVQSRTHQVEELKSDLRARDVEISHLRQAVADASRRLDELYRSLSWRWTRPGRAMYRLFRGR